VDAGKPAEPFTTCPRCYELEDQVADLQDRLGRAGLLNTFTPGANPRFDGERELRRWLAAHPRADAATAFRAGWERMARFVGPRLREWEARWWILVRENERLRAHIGRLITEVSRLSDRD
jgi:hypothetical protein